MDSDRRALRAAGLALAAEAALTTDDSRAGAPAAGQLVRRSKCSALRVRTVQRCWCSQIITD
jgi:hypothetical protein